MEPLIILLPLFGAILAKPAAVAAGPRAAEIVTTVLVGISALLSWLTFLDIGANGAKDTITFFQWIQSGSFNVSWSMRLDTLTAVMLIVVTSVSSLVHLYSIGYMHEDPSRPRFFAYLSLFTFAMLALVTADDLVQLFFGWEGVGLASYLLIGFWHHKDSANDASIKAFVMNRVGDVGLALGIMAVFVAFGTVKFDPIFAALADGVILPLGGEGPIPIAEASMTFLDRQYSVLDLIGVLLFIGAMGKSAQLGLHTWLPDAMEGPTPVSALIHAATMVTAGVFLVCRMSDLYALAPAASALVTVIGASTAIFAATIGLVQTDIKRVIAYSTASQLGYMFFAAGVGGYAQAMFHLTTHAFFKALLFLGAGAVIHFCHHEQDMRSMGGLRNHMPVTFVAMLLGTLAITGVGIPMVQVFGAPFGFAGFVSKDYILEAAYEGITLGVPFATYAFVLGILAAVLTGFYSWRLIFLTFDGGWRADDAVKKHPHPVPNTMILPLLPLALGAVIAGMAFYKPFVGAGKTAFWGESLHIEASYEAAAHDDAAYDAAEAGPAAVNADHGMSSTHEISGAEGDHGAAPSVTDHGAEAHKAEGHGEAHHDFPAWVLWAPLIAGLIGFFAAFTQYRATSDPLRPGLISRGGLLYGFLQNRWYIDVLYRRIFLEPARILARALWRQGDERTIDGLGPNGLSGFFFSSAKRLVGIQTGYVFTYAFIMLAGVTLIVLFTMLRGGA
ncbi:NADH dehydrogenase subunit L [Parvularcula bermudensis HTCC2503]|uniref:NADH dehydrogenase subunit L n=1 Tax=Parvularcula bermudensis (strain ATCC BAA-594 / HTCC2503 / KCTC 12087) TaxID=314260 RepID=E0TDV7_PARBH|nr:NADH-quinone oxidoreductase subunit L [Parvularcula bermudensis]ADM10406.1 NADH dehydrogenase subunit L [Parvularcula bermudensis HTCC2503]